MATKQLISRGIKMTADRVHRVSHTVRSASVGDSRAARSAGRRPAMAPMAMEAPNPPAQATAGTTMAQCLVEA